MSDDIQSTTFEFQQAKLRFETANANRKFEIELFWKRSAFFWGFTTVAFGAYGLVLSKAPVYLPIVASFGFVSAVVWHYANRASTYWQKVWEAKTAEDEKKVLGSEVYFNWPELADVEKRKGMLSAHRFSLGKTVAGYSLYTVALWVLLTLAGLIGAYICSASLWDYVASTVGLVWCIISVGYVVFWLRGRVDNTCNDI